MINDKVSAHSYLVDLNGAVKHLHADKLRKYHINVDEISCDTLRAGQINTRINHCAIIHEEDQDFGGHWNFESGFVNIMIFSKISKYRKYRNITIFSIHIG